MHISKKKKYLKSITQLPSQETRCFKKKKQFKHKQGKEKKFKQKIITEIKEIENRKTAEKNQ